MKVIYLDPDDYYQRTFQRQAEPFAEVVGVRRGKEIFSAIRTHRPDAVVMELLLEDEHGHLLLEQLRTSQEFSYIPVIVFSQLGSTEDMEKAQNLGVNGFFVKGRDSVDQVKQTIRNLS